MSINKDPQDTVHKVPVQCTEWGVQPRGSQLIAGLPLPGALIPENIFLFFHLHLNKIIFVFTRCLDIWELFLLLLKKIASTAKRKYKPTYTYTNTFINPKTQTASARTQLVNHVHAKMQTHTVAQAKK